MRRELAYALLGGFVLSVIPADATHAELVGQWRFDEGAGTIAADASGKGNDGTLQGGPTFVDGRFGLALSFANSRVAVPASDSLTADLFRGSFTLCAWINPKRAGATWQQVFRSVKANGESNDTLFINNDGRLSWRGRLGGTWTTLCETTAGVVPANQWTHVAVTGDGTSFRIYINGARARESAFRTTNGTNATYYIGGDPKFPGESYAGMMDDVRLYDHAMSQEDISLAMQTQGGAILKAYGPNPADGAIHLQTWATLSWMPGSTADSHDVYFGESFADVRDGTGGTFRGNQRSTSIPVGVPESPYPDGLAADATYYWRVDEVETDGVTKHRGEVWSFSIPSRKAHIPVPPDGAKSVATNVTLTWVDGLGAESHTVYFGDDFDVVNNAAGGSGQVATIYTPGPLEFAKTYYWRVDEFDGAVTYKGDVWSFTTTPEDVVGQLLAVPTFHCIGVYWSSQVGSSDNVCQVRYRSAGSTDWREALPLWYDNREVGGYPRGYRGSIVGLEPGMTYEIELRLLNTGTTEIFTASAWSEDFPIANTVYLPAGTTNQPLEIIESGSPDGYILYTHPEGESSIIDVNDQKDSCIYVSASYIIIRGLTLRQARVHGIRILNNAHDVIIEECDISGWGRLQEGQWGYEFDSAVYSNAPNIERIIVQRNKLHHPRSDTNSWKEPARTIPINTNHPMGPQAITFTPRNERAGHFVIRYNEIYSDDDHYFNDSMGDWANFSYHGFPVRDSDIYGNYIERCWDDGIQAEGANCNVRIWGNYITRTATKIATQSNSVGPLYIWRNVFGISRVGPNDNVAWRAFKYGDVNGYGGAKTYIFHNTILQPPAPDRGSRHGIEASDSQQISNTCTRNNILHVPSGDRYSINNPNPNSTNDFDYDLYNGLLHVSMGHELNGIYGIPAYIPSSGYDRTTNKGIFELSSYSLGYDAGEVIPNFNDNYNGAAPDIGAHETGSPPMEFGVKAYQQN